MFDGVMVAAGMSLSPVAADTVVVVLVAAGASRRDVVDSQIDVVESRVLSVVSWLHYVSESRRGSRDALAQACGLARA